MKVKLVKRGGKLIIYCANGSILKPNDSDLINLLTSFKKPHIFKGEDGIWNTLTSDINNTPGEMLAYIDDTNKLIVIDDSVFKRIIRKDTQYISASEYADLKGKSRPSIKNMCAAGRIPGAYKTSSGWLIPADAPYPERKKRETKAK